MPVQYTYLRTENIIQVKCFGELTMNEIVAYFSDLKEDTAIPKGAAELVDLSHITYFNVDHTEAAHMPADYIPAHSAKGVTATILFGATRVNMGLTRLIEAHFRKNLPQHCFVAVDTHWEAMEKLAKFRQTESVM